MSRIPVWLAAVVLMMLIPLVALAQINVPPLSGEYRVGKLNYDWTDSTRPEIFTDDPKDQREILVTVYYPAQPAADAQPAPYAEGAMLQALAAQYNIPAEAISQIHPHSYANAPAVDGSFPILVFEPGWGAPTVIYSLMLEDLASHGYIVAGVWTTYSSDFTVFPDGRVIKANQAGSDPDQYTQDDTVALDARKLVGGVWADDARFTVSQLTQLNDSDPILKGHIDTSHVGMYGHSFGGAASVEAAARDPRFQAIIDIDGSLINPDAKPTINVPFMLMTSDFPAPTPDMLATMSVPTEVYGKAAQGYVQQSRDLASNGQPGYFFRLAGSSHQTYISDEAVFAAADPTLLGDNVGSIDPARAIYIYDGYIAAFFDQYLKGFQSSLLQSASPVYPEVTLETFPKH